MNLTPEQRVKIAEWMGKDFRYLPEMLADFEHKSVQVLGQSSWIYYTPDTNDAQNRELEVKLMLEGWNFEYCFYKPDCDCPGFIGINPIKALGPVEKETLNLTVCHAVLALGEEG